jgi:hypothetical protein
MAYPTPSYAPPAPSPVVIPEKRFKALRFFGSLYKVIGIIIGVISTLGAIGICGLSAISGSALDSLSNTFGQSSSGFGLFGGLLGGVISGVVILIYGGLAAITLYAMGELVYLFIGMEENTRATAAMLQQRGG